MKSRRTLLDCVCSAGSPHSRFIMCFHQFCGNGTCTIVKYIDCIITEDLYGHDEDLCLPVHMAYYDYLIVHVNLVSPTDQLAYDL